MEGQTTFIIQVSNISALATLKEMKTLFGFLGRIKEIQMYPKLAILKPQFKICYIKYVESWSVGVAQHLTNTVFIDRALIVVPYFSKSIPNEDNTGFEYLNPTTALPGLPSSFNDIINEVAAIDGNLMITSMDPMFEIFGLPQYPPLPANLDPSKIENIRKSVYINNINLLVKEADLLNFVKETMGDVKHLQISGVYSLPTKSAIVEFVSRSSVIKALQNDGIIQQGNVLRITHSTGSIMNLNSSGQILKQEKINEAMKQFKKAELLINDVLSTGNSRSRGRSRSRSRRSSSREKKQSSSKYTRSRSRERKPSYGNRSHSKTYKCRSKSRSRGSRSTSVNSCSDRKKYKEKQKKHSHSPERSQQCTKSCTRSCCMNSRSSPRKKLASPNLNKSVDLNRKSKFESLCSPSMKSNSRKRSHSRSPRKEQKLSQKDNSVDHLASKRLPFPSVISNKIKRCHSRSPKKTQEAPKKDVYEVPSEDSHSPNTE